MNKQQAQQTIRDTFESSFNKDGFTGFIKNLLNEIEDAPLTYQGNYIPDGYKQNIKILERVGKFSDGENSIDVLVITLQKGTSLERARTMQRNFIAWYLNGSRGGEMKDAALVAFVSPGEEDWRFSLVKMDYKFEKTKTGRMKVKEEFTPARRWSFLVGVNEKSHTAQSRLVKILENDEQAPNLEEIEKAFDIETVTKEFFLKYRELFLRTKEELDRVIKKDPKIKANFKATGVDAVNFAKKLLGQIVFLYFLQKKGWFGVSRDDEWGTGSKHFLRELFEKKHANYQNFFNDILEPLFYEALRTGEDRKHEDYYYSKFDCKIPFLNGGLFDPIGNYDWVHTDIIVPDKLFSNTKKTKEGDTGDGILDVFDRYNFTVKEDEPLEKEVAIDPELLGKAYEKFNAIRPDNYDEFRKALKSGKTGEENKFNKKFGVYYTPREIVHYMCQQSLINYLAAELDGKANKEDIETLIHTGEQVSENEVTALIKEQNIKDRKQKTSGYKLQLPESIRKNAKLIDKKLENITVCDPAVGSGAFPVGVMNEIIRTRNVLSAFVKDKNRTPYEFKRRCIEYSLYGVDIDPGAVEIAKLRLWLSLIVDEEDIKNIKPLPNLDYRIMQGNSLISEFMGINFYSGNEKNTEYRMLKDETDELVEYFQQKKDEFLNESNVSQKSKLKEENDDLLVKIFETKLRTQKADYFDRLKNIENKYSVLRNQEQKKELIKRDKEKLYKESGFDLESVEKQLKEFTSGRQIKPFFLWSLYFSEVFHNKGGFDVVIANPPYVMYSRVTGSNNKNSKGDNTIKKQLMNLYPRSAEYKISTYALFMDRSISLLGPKGVLSYITPDSFLIGRYFSKLRKLILDECLIVAIVLFTKDFWQSAVVGLPTISILKKVSKVKEDQKLKAINAISLQNFSNKEYSQYSYCQSYFESLKFNRFRLFFNEKDYNLVNKIDAKTIEAGVVVDMKVGVRPKVGYKKVQSHIKEGKRWHKGFVHGNEIEKYCAVWQGNYININPSLLWGGGFDEDIVKQEKLLMRKTGNSLIVGPDFSGYYHLDILHSIVLINSGYSLKYIMSILNSSLMQYYYKIITLSYDRVMAQTNIETIKGLPFKKLSLGDQNPFIEIVDKILSITRNDDYLQNLKKQVKVKALEAEIDQLVYQLYGLTEKEIKVIEGLIKTSG
ncbi:Eco57I restriction-modification methylase domain-containing protein [Bacteroidota bacterium]